MEKKYDLESRLIRFGNKAIDIAEGLPNSYTGNYLAGQLIRSSTSPLLNYGEAQSAESLADFIHKMKICLKELRETYNCLRLIEQRRWLKNSELELILRENNELIAIFSSSIITASKRKPVPKK
jgi:four helix bundle protein